MENINSNTDYGMEVFKDMFEEPELVRFEERYCTKGHGKYQVQILRYGKCGDEFENITECPSCTAEKLEQMKLQEEKELRLQQIEILKSQNIEPEFYDKELKDYVPENENQKKALQTVKELIENRSGKVILLGSNGVGKTMLGSCAVKILGGKILSMYEIVTMIRQSYSMNSKQTELEIVNELASMPFLVIDELGRTKGSDAELNWLSYVLDKRHTRNLPFMILSNTHLKSKCTQGGCSQCFENYMNNDILSRLRVNSKLINVDGKDYRAIKK